MATDPATQAERPTCPMCTFLGKPCPGGAHVYAQYEDGIRSVEDYVKKCKPAGPTSQAQVDRRALQNRVEMFGEEAGGYVFRLESKLVEAESALTAAREQLDDRDNHIKLAYDALGDVNHGIYLFDHIRKLREERDRAQEAMRAAVPILEHFARENPIWRDFTGQAQDPAGVHALLARAPEK